MTPQQTAILLAMPVGVTLGVLVVVTIIRPLLLKLDKWIAKQGRRRDGRTDRQQIEQATKAQLPWDEPTEAEIQSALITFDSSLRMRVDSQEARLDAMAQSLGWLIASRNAALQPKPVDPRREKIVDAIHRYGYFGNKEALADNIIVALDEVK